MGLHKHKILLVSLIIVAVFVIITFFVHQYFRWEVINGFASLVLAAGVGIAIWQIIETRQNTKDQLETIRSTTKDQLDAISRSTNAQIAVELFRELRGEESKSTLRDIIYKLEESQPDRLPNEELPERDRIDALLDKFELLAALVKQEIISRELAIEPFGGPAAVRCWYILGQPYIKANRDKRGYFCENFEGYARLCLDHFFDAGIYVNLIRNAKTTDVIKELQKPELKPRTWQEIAKQRKKPRSTP